MAQTQLEGGPRLDVTRHYPVAPEKVWHAWTDPQALSHWFGPGGTESVTRVELDVRPGGRYQIAFRTSDGQAHDVSGEYHEVTPHRRLSFTWAWKSTPERVSFVSIELAATPHGCEMRFVHERFFDEQARINHGRGWTGTFARLDAFLRG